MTDLRTAAQQALEALEALQGGCTDSNDGTVEAITVWCPEIITALRAALAEPVQEPAYKVKITGRWHDAEPFAAAFSLPDGEHLLYTAPPQRPAEPVQEPVLTVDALRVEFERRYRGNLGITRVEGGAYLSPAIETEWQQFVRKYTTPPQRKPVEWDGRCMLGHCNSPAGCENSGECRAVERAHGIGGEG